MSALHPHIVAFRALAKALDAQVALRLEQADMAKSPETLCTFRGVAYTLDSQASALRDAADDLEEQMRKREAMVKPIPDAAPSNQAGS